MDVKYFYASDEERPLDRIVSDGGFCGIFRTMGFVGDSLSSGEFESMKDGVRGYHDMYEFSWGQYIARMTGSKAYNFSRGGMTAKEMLGGFYADCGLFDDDKRCSCYVVALGCNDLFSSTKAIPLGTMRDVGTDADTFARYYSEIISKLKEKQPRAKFFLVTMPRDGVETPLADGHAALMHDFAKHFSNTYVVDLRAYGPVYDKEFKRRFYLGGHINPMGYMLTAKLVASYIDFIIRKYPEDFSEAGFIGTDLHNETAKY